FFGNALNLYKRFSVRVHPGAIDIIILLHHFRDPVR
ncbi:MAG: hypothetical protein ACI8XX_000776, partial [Polaribacter sp.]